MAQHADTADGGHQGHAFLTQMFDQRQVAALGIGIVAVQIAAEDQAALVRLADIEMSGPEGDDPVDEGFQRFRHKGLQQVTFDRQGQSGQRRDLAGMPGDGHADLLRLDRAAWSGHP